LRIKHILHIILILSLSLSSVLAFAKASATTDDKAKILETLLKQFDEMCLNEQGKILDKTIVIDQDSALSDGQTLSCKDEAARLSAMIQGLHKEIETAKSLTLPPASVSCIQNQNGAQPIDEQYIINSSQGLYAILETQDCHSFESATCFKDIGCNVLNSTILKSITAPFNLKSCPDKNKSNCASETVAGILKDFWSNLTGIWDLAKMTVKGTKNLAIKTWKHFSSVEDKTSEAALLASTQSDSSFALFKKDPAAFMKLMASSIVTMIDKSIKENFGCEKWEGKPHLSKCVTPMSNWSCASCDQKTNAICGVAGVLADEILVAWLSGGVVTIGSKVASKGALTISKLNEVMITSLPKLKKVELGIATASKASVAPIVKSFQFAEKIIASQSSQRILNFVKTKGSAFANVTSKTAGVKPIAFTLKVVKGALSPVTGYLNLLSKSFAAGLAYPDLLLGVSSNKLAKLSEVLARNEKMGDIEDVIINTKMTEAISPEVLQAKLKKENIEFEQVKMEDGTIGTKVKMDPSCSVSGKGTVFFK
jgi:hypothetical protein